eukprot:UN20158
MFFSFVFSCYHLAPKTFSYQFDVYLDLYLQYDVFCLTLGSLY